MNFDLNVQWTYSAGLMNFATRGSRPDHLTCLKTTTVALVNCLFRFYSNPDSYISGNLSIRQHCDCCIFTGYFRLPNSLKVTMYSDCRIRVNI